MKRYKKIAAVCFAIVFALAGFYYIAPGFSKNGNAYIADYSVSEDGREMTIKVGVFSSIGYIRKVSVHQQHGGKLYLDFYSAFGGINGSVGAQNEYKFQIAEDTETIAIYRSNDCYEQVLEKDSFGQWQRSR